VSVVSDILAAAQAKKMGQRDLAAKAGLSAEGLSRLKKRGSARLNVIENLARAAGVRLSVVAEDTLRAPASPPAVQTTFRQKYRHLIWSDSKAPDILFVRRALLQPNFPMLLDATVEFGLPTIEREWDALEAEGTQEARLAAPITARILRHIRHGYEQSRS
jgi:transcriptional regulator with XRE-family HTH domain